MNWKLSVWIPSKGWQTLRTDMDEWEAKNMASAKNKLIRQAVGEFTTIEVLDAPLFVAEEE